MDENGWFGVDEYAEWMRMEVKQAEPGAGFDAGLGSGSAETDCGFRREIVEVVTGAERVG